MNFEEDLLADRYSILRCLGRGATGSAHRATDQRLGRDCVIKQVLRSDDIGSHERFEREAKLLAALDHHPNLPVVYDYFIEGDKPYIVMEFVKGTTLDRFSPEEREAFSILTVLKWARELLDALHYIHSQSPPIIHRDIKPSNICITPDRTAVLLDFDIARRLDETKTVTAAKGRTDGYAPIEQYSEEQLRDKPPEALRLLKELHEKGIRTGPYSDIYSLGATLYFVMTGSRPLDSYWRADEDSLKSVQERNPNVPIYLSGTVMKALSLHPKDRFQSAAEMLEALQPQIVKQTSPKQRWRPKHPRLPESLEVFGQEVIYIPGGTFSMGSNDPELKRGSRPQHPVDLGPYCLAQYPVRNEDYQRFIDDNPHYPVPYSPMGTAQRYNWDPRARTFPPELGNHPVVLVTWYDALAYCNWLSKVSQYHFRLPTEAEWEKAACWNPDQEVSQRFPWGDAFDEARCNVNTHGAPLPTSTPVDSFSPAGDSPYELADMAGNVWEWTSSLYRLYPYDADDGREDLGPKGERVVRGGSYKDGPLWARSAWRSSFQPNQRFATIGFRVLCEAEVK